MSKHPLTIDQSKCLKCGTCVATYPDLFEFVPGDVTVRVKPNADFSKIDLEKVQNVCPAQAIVRIEELDKERHTQKK